MHQNLFEELQKIAETEFGIKIKPTNRRNFSFETLFGSYIEREKIMSFKDPIGDRMKENYENRAKTYLTRRTPVIIRLDGKAFHTFTRGFRKPYDEVFHASMNDTMKYLCENIQGCKFGYTQSDEITLLLTDYDTLTTDAWFGYSVQKLCSVSASMATLEFNRQLRHHIMVLTKNDGINEEHKEDLDYAVALGRALTAGALFDSRCFNIPKEEVTNCFIWRQQDATRNAVQMLGQCHFSSNDLDGKNQSEVREMLARNGIIFDEMPAAFKRGVCCVKADDGGWVIDTEIPVFTLNREYVTKWINPDEE